MLVPMMERILHLLTRSKLVYCLGGREFYTLLKVSCMLLIWKDEYAYAYRSLPFKIWLFPLLRNVPQSLLYGWCSEFLALGKVLVSSQAN